MNNSAVGTPIVDENKCRCKNCNVVFPSRNKLFKHIEHCLDPMVVQQQLLEQNEQKKRAIELDRPKQLENLKNVEDTYQRILSNCHHSSDLQDFHEFLEFFLNTHDAIAYIN
jgi:hypothetical protein